MATWLEIPTSNQSKHFASSGSLADIPPIRHSKDISISPAARFELKLYAYPKADREPVKILVIGSKQAVSAIVVALHQLGFAEIFEWTDFLPAPTAERPLQSRQGEVMKALVKYLPRD